MNTTSPLRIVLDTNVCLDLFVFQDPRWHPLRTALEARTVDAITRTDCRNEWLRVLDYPHLPLDASKKEHAMALFDQHLQCIEIATVNTFGLPICTDKDDQKFLELSLQCDAAYLVTKDKALLKLAKKTARRGMFAIHTPERFMQVLTGTGCS